MTYTQFWNLVRERKVDSVRFADDRRSVRIVTKASAPGGARTGKPGGPRGCGTTRAAGAVRLCDGCSAASRGGAGGAGRAAGPWPPSPAGRDQHFGMPLPCRCLPFHTDLLTTPASAAACGSLPFFSPPLPPPLPAGSLPIFSPPLPPPLPAGTHRSSHHPCLLPLVLPAAEKVGLPFDPDLFDHLVEHG